MVKFPPTLKTQGCSLWILHKDLHFLQDARIFTEGDRISFIKFTYRASLSIAHGSLECELYIGWTAHYFWTNLIDRLRCLQQTLASTTGEIPCTEWPDKWEHFHLRSQLEALVKQDFSNHWLVVMVYLTICFQSLLGIDGTHDIEVLTLKSASNVGVRGLESHSIHKGFPGSQWSHNHNKMIETHCSCCRLYWYLDSYRYFMFIWFTAPSMQPPESFPFWPNLVLENLSYLVL